MSGGVPGNKPCSARISATEHVRPARCAAVGLLAAFHLASAITAARRALGCQPPAMRRRWYR